MPTHYEVLGVPATASPEQLRAAYVGLAQRLHPDRVDGDARRMQEVNEAWRVLGDPGRRQAYDASLAPPAPPPPPEVDPMDVPFHGPLAEPGDVGVAIARALPWVAILVVLALIFLVTAVAGQGGGDDEEDLVGRCVRIGRATEVRSVPCSGPSDGRVELVVDRPALCPDRSDGQRVDDDRWLCLAPVTP